MSLPSGHRLGPYEIVAPLGAGGMGEVYRAKDTRLGREVAIKVLSSEVASDPDRLRRFEQEARAASALSHPNILTLFDVGRHEATSYLVTELLEGESLRERLAHGPLPPRKAIELGAAVARGLAAAHAKGIVHRDLKPENLFLSRDGGVKILDFGLAKLTLPESGGMAEATTIPGLTATGMVMGTAGYMAPEQVRGEAADARSDLFALGCVLYEVVAGRRAFAGDTAPETFSAILRDDPPPLALATGSAGALEAIVRRCLEKRPDERFQSARDLGFALEALAGTEPPGTTVPRTAHRPSRGFPRGRLGLAAALVLGLALGATGAWLTTLGSTTAPRALEFHRITFRRGNLLHARFAPDGQSVLYGAAWEGRPTEVFSTRVDDATSEPLGVASADLLAVSKQRRVLVLRKSADLYFPEGTGTLAETTMSGDAPRDLAESIHGADWLPDGRIVAIRHLGDYRDVLELPPGNKILEAATRFVVRVSPDGRRIACLVGTREDALRLTVIDLEGREEWSSPLLGVEGFAWHPGGEIWLTRSRGPEAGIWAIRPGGSLRSVLRGAGWILHDVSPEGRLLVERGIQRASVHWKSAAAATERDLAWFDSSQLRGLSADGSVLLLSEIGEGAGRGGAVFLRRSDGSPAVRLSEGGALALSDDARWALVRSPGEPPRYVLTPAGAGTPRPLSFGNESALGAIPMPGGEPRFLVSIGESLEESRIEEVGLVGAPVKRLDRGFIGANAAVSPDGQFVALSTHTGEQRRLEICGLASGSCRDAAPLEGQEEPLQWSSDGRFVYLREYGHLPTRVVRLELATGLRSPWLALGDAGDSDTHQVGRVRLTRDGGTYAFDRTEVSDSSLFVVDGLE